MFVLSRLSWPVMIGCLSFCFVVAVEVHLIQTARPMIPNTPLPPFILQRQETPCYPVFFSICFTCPPSSSFPFTVWQTMWSDFNVHFCANVWASRHRVAKTPWPQTHTHTHSALSPSGVCLCQRTACVCVCVSGEVNPSETHSLTLSISLWCCSDAADLNNSLNHSLEIESKVCFYLYLLEANHLKKHDLVFSDLTWDFCCWDLVQFHSQRVGGTWPCWSRTGR